MNIGKVLKDRYCNGYFGRDSYKNSRTIILEGDIWIVTMSPSDKYPEIACFYNAKEKQECIDRWTSFDDEDDY